MNQNKFIASIIVLVVLCGVSIMAAIHYENRAKHLDSLVRRLSSKLIDANERLDLYRLSVEQTEMRDLNSAQVFETTEAFRELWRMNENEYFQTNDKFLHSID